MNNKRIQVGDRSGKRVVLAIDPSGTLRRMKVRIRCECGYEAVTGAHTFRATTACKGCNRGGAKRKYGDRTMQTTKIYHSWIAMRRRCDPTVDGARNARWAGRGITVCREWQHSFAAFEKWALANGYRPGLSIDRIDPDGNYEPSNCEWVTRGENSRRCRAGYIFVPRQSPDAGISDGILSFGS